MAWLLSPGGVGNGMLVTLAAAKSLILLGQEWQSQFPRHHSPLLGRYDLLVDWEVT